MTKLIIGLEEEASNLTRISLDRLRGHSRECRICGTNSLKEIEPEEIAIISALQKRSLVLWK